MKLFAIALLARKSEKVFERFETIPAVVAADSEREAGKEAKREARKTYPKSDGWLITGTVIEIDYARLLETIMRTEDEIALSLSGESSKRIH